MPKSNPRLPFGRGSGAVTIIEQPVMRSYIRKAKITFFIIWAAVALLAATVLVSKVLRGRPASFPARRPRAYRRALKENTTVTGHIAAGGIALAVPVLSMFDQVHIGADEFGASVHMKVIYKNLLAAGRARRRQVLAAGPFRRARRAVSAVPPGAVRREAGRAQASTRRSPMSSSAPTSATPSSRCAAYRRVLNNRCAWLEARPAPQGRTLLTG